MRMCDDAQAFFDAHARARTSRLHVIFARATASRTDVMVWTAQAGSKKWPKERDARLHRDKFDPLQSSFT